MAQKRVLAIGRVAAVNQWVVSRLVERGLDAVGAAGDGDFPELDARGFDLVAIGAGVDAPTRALLKQRFAAQHPGVLLLDAYGPLAAEQIESALRRSEGTAAISELAIDDAGEVWQARVTVARACRLRVELYQHRGSREPAIVPVAEVLVTAGAQAFAVAKAREGEMQVLVVRADGELEVRRIE
jgi:hypothetical protein